MSNILGSLFVELGINAAAFQEGLQKATYMAQKAGKDMQKSFHELGDSIGALAGAFGVLGPAGAAGVEAISLAGQAAGKAIKEFSSFNSTLGVFGGVAAGVAAGAASIAVSMIGLAVETSKSIKEQGEMAEKSGMSIEQFTKWAYVAKIAGVSQETFGRSTVLLSTNMLAAAEGSKRMQSGFNQVGVAFANGDGTLRNTGDVMDDLNKKFSQMADGAQKIALMRQLMGRGGAQMAPVMNEDPAKLKQQKDDAAALGVALDNLSVDSAKHFQEALLEIQSAGTGLSYQLTKELLPALQSVADQLVTALKDPSSGLHDLIDAFVWVTKVVITLGEVTFKSFQAIGETIGSLGTQMYEFGTQIGGVLSKAAHGDFSGAKKDFETMNQQIADTAQITADKITKSFESVYAIWDNGGKGSQYKDPGPKQDKPKPPPALVASTAPAEVDMVAKLVADLKAQATAENDVAASYAASKGALVVLNADRAASVKIAETQIALEAKIKQAEENKQRLAGTQASSQQLAAAQDKINIAKRELAELKTDTPQIIALYEQQATAKSGSEVNSHLAEGTRSLKEQAEALKGVAEAYAQGGDAIANSEIESKLAADKQAVAELTDELAALQPGTDAFNNMAKQVAVANAQLAEHRTQLQGIKQDDIADTIAKEAAALRGEAEAFTYVSAAADSTLAARRQANADAAGAKVYATTGNRQQADQAAAAELEKETQSYLMAVANKGAQMDLGMEYERQVEELNDIRTMYKGNADVQLAANAQQLNDLNNMNAEWAKQAIEVGDMSQKWQGWLTQVQAAGNNMGQALFQNLTQALDSFNSSLTTLIVTGKANFKELGKSIESDFMKTGLKGLESQAAGMLKGAGGPLGALGGALGGGGPLGSKGNPMYVMIVSGQPGAGQPAGAGSLIPGMGGSGVGVLGTETNPMYTMDASGITGGLGGAGGSDDGMGGGATSAIMSLVGLFGGMFRAEGGDVTPGKAYIVGEQHPEFFVPGKSGSIAPTIRAGGGGGDTHYHNWNIQTPDADSFRKSQGQIARQMAQAMGQAAGRS